MGRNFTSVIKAMGFANIVLAGWGSFGFMCLLGMFYSVVAEGVTTENETIVEFTQIGSALGAATLILALLAFLFILFVGFYTWTEVGIREKKRLYLILNFLGIGAGVLVFSLTSWLLPLCSSFACLVTLILSLLSNEEGESVVLP